MLQGERFAVVGQRTAGDVAGAQPLIDLSPRGLVGEARVPHRRSAMAEVQAEGRDPLVEECDLKLPTTKREPTKSGVLAVAVLRLAQPRDQLRFPRAEAQCVQRTRAYEPL